MLGTWLKGDGGALERVGLRVCLVYDVVIEQRPSFAASRVEKRKRRMTDSLSWCNEYLVDGRWETLIGWPLGTRVGCVRATRNVGFRCDSSEGWERNTCQYGICRIPYTRFANNDNCHGAFENDGSWEMGSMEPVCGPRE
jgi:hypothetical protein